MPDPTPPPAQDPKSQGTDPASLVDQADHFKEPHPKDDAGQDAKIAALEAKVKELEEQVKRLSDLAGRAQADLQNAKQRMERDAQGIRQFAAESLLMRFLPTIDNFQRAFQHLPEDLKNHEWVKGVAAMEQDFIKQVTEMGLKKMDAMGQAVDPQKHEVLMTGEGEEGKVIDVLEEGYELHGKVLRPAKVKAGSGR